MASRHGPLRMRTSTAGAYGALAVLAVVSLPALIALGLSGPGSGSVSLDFLRRAVSFTLLQAGLSTVISVGLGVVLARALSRRHFIGRA